MKRWIVVQELGSGWAAVCFWLNDEDYPGESFPEPYVTGEGRYATRTEAERDARVWADAEGIPFVDEGMTNTDIARFIGVQD